MSTTDGNAGRCCRTCGHGLRAAARFCDECGAPVNSTEARGERKQITVLFADVVGSMALASALGPERLHEVMGELFTRSAEVVQRCLGTVDKFTGDGLMALFGAPAALEDHALRACVAALEIQSAAAALGSEVRARYGVEVMVRIGLNSGEVVAGSVGLGPGSYTAVGHPVGLAQRMESAAPPGGVLCSASTADLVERSALLGPTEWVVVKGDDAPLPARRLEGLRSLDTVTARDDGPFVGRDAEAAALREAHDARMVPLAAIIGDPGVGKSRLIREFVRATEAVGASSVWTRCEWHTANVPLRAVSRLLRELFGVRGLDAAAARDRIASRLSAAGCDSPDDVAILCDLLPMSAADSDSSLSADARRRRLIELLALAAMRSGRREVLLVEDVHWADEACDTLFAELAEALSGTDAFMVVTYRPEYVGALRAVPHRSISLAPLPTTTAVALAARLLGTQPTAAGAAELIATSAAGNPFFVEEIVRDLAGRRILEGERGAHRLVRPLHSVAVPATVQSVLAARIDRLPRTHKSVLNAASVIGTAFDSDVLRAVMPTATTDDLNELVAQEMIDRIELRPRPRYAFRHPLVRSVAYDSQLTATRSDAHSRLARAIEAREPAAADQNASLIGHHVEASGDHVSAHGWFMRSGEWLRSRDLVAARASWDRARVIADRLYDDGDATIAMRIAPRAMLTSTAWRVGGAGDDAERFAELRTLTAKLEDWLSLAVGMAGRVTSLIVTDGLLAEAAALGTELLGVVGHVDGHVEETADALMSAAFAQYEACELDQVLATTDRIRAIAADTSIAELGSATAISGLVKILTGRREAGTVELAEGIRLARLSDPVTYVITVAYRTDLVVHGFDVGDAEWVRETGEALTVAEAHGNAYGMAIARWSHGTALIRSGRCDDGIELLLRLRSHGAFDPVGCLVDAEIAAALASRGAAPDVDALDAAVWEELQDAPVFVTGFAAAVLVESLLARAHPGDSDRARAVLDHMERQCAAESPPVLRLWPQRCRALLGASAEYESVVRRYHEMAVALDARGHVADARLLLDRRPGR